MTTRTTNMTNMISGAFMAFSFAFPVAFQRAMWFREAFFRS
jgi:hypothetical protein